MASAYQFYRFFIPPFADDKQFRVCLFAHARAQAVLHGLRQGIETRQQLIVCTGEAGLGKSRLLHAYLESIDPQQLQAIVLTTLPQTFDDFLMLVSQALAVKQATDDRTAGLVRLRQALRAASTLRRQVVCFIDQAHEWPLDLLAQVLTLAHLEARAEPLLQIVLVGRPALQHALKHPQVRDLTAGCVLCPTLVPFTKQESAAYIQHCLVQSGAQPAAIFTPGAIKSLVAHGQGNPRTLNSLCQRVLQAGAQLQQQPISAATARQVLVGRPRPPLRHWSRQTFVGSLGLGLVLGLTLTGLWYHASQRSPYDAFSPEAQQPAASPPLAPHTVAKPTAPAFPLHAQPVPQQLPGQPAEPGVPHRPLPSSASVGQEAQPLAAPTALPSTPQDVTFPGRKTRDDACLLNMLQGKPCSPVPTPGQPQGAPTRP